MNKTQKVIVAVAVPVIVFFVGFHFIGYDLSISNSIPTGAGIVLNPIKYFSYSGLWWALVVLIIGVFEFFLWKTPKTKK